MAWIELHQEFRGHFKVDRLAQSLKVDRATAGGHVIYLWLWAVSYAANGDLTSFSDEEIACGAMWTQDPEKFVKSLLECKFLARRGDRLSIHDWKNYGLKFLKAQRERTRKHRAQKKVGGEGDTLQKRDGHVTDTSPSHGGHVTVTSTLPNHTLPNHTIKKGESSPTGEDPLTVNGVRDRWNKLAEECGLAKVVELSQFRRRAVSARTKEKAFDLEKIFTKIRASKWMRGENDRGWRADFDFVFCSANNYLKILEGKYDDRKGGGNKPQGESAWKMNEEARKKKLEQRAGEKSAG